MRLLGRSRELVGAYVDRAGGFAAHSCAPSCAQRAAVLTGNWNYVPPYLSLAWLALLLATRTTRMPPLLVRVRGTSASLRDDLRIMGCAW